MPVQRLCARHGRYVGNACPTCRRDRATREKPPSRQDRIRATLRWKKVAAAAAERDGHRCTFGLFPGDRGAAAYPDGRCPVRDRLDGHHVVALEDGGAPYDLENVRSVCRTHHARLEAARREEK